MARSSATRMNLLRKKDQIALAEQGLEALKNKRDALFQEFLSLVKDLAAFRDTLEHSSREAVNALILASALDGRQQLQSLALASKRDVTIQIEEKSLWGVVVPEVEKVSYARSFLERGVSPTGTTSRIDEVAEGFERIVDLVIEMAPTEIQLKRLGQEIQKTTRRIHTLEQQLIPSLEQEVRAIQHTLEEREREDVFRLKRLKKKSRVTSGK
ncbi:V-type ATP synthase subunit D [candidate division KSB3 bacterium]|uniref:V-type ATP synthase subunit D n=1 Tax=candidate division KSB3 bacterium TaxID=2044937 RepID=A0A9D5JTG2_9BACT|nr:V-type ATP synthase subunit D [candidate division KSB3 bacterium]MBD3323785.1 V-type ATP synthase subunit D [candidate division KSB3 bacterium]